MPLILKFVAALLVGSLIKFAPWILEETFGEDYLPDWVGIAFATLFWGGLLLGIPLYFAFEFLQMEVGNWLAQRKLEKKKGKE